MKWNKLLVCTHFFIRPTGAIAIRSQEAMVHFKPYDFSDTIPKCNPAIEIN